MTKATHHAGGVAITSFQPTARFAKDFRKLPHDLRDRVEEALKKLQMNPRPAGVRFEKLQQPPDTYSIHVTGNYKISFNVDGNCAILRRVAPHKEIDRAP